jgi:hypothetical protein
MSLHDYYVGSGNSVVYFDFLLLVEPSRSSNKIEHETFQPVDRS